MITEDKKTSRLLPPHTLSKNDALLTSDETSDTRQLTDTRRQIFGENQQTLAKKGDETHAWSGTEKGRNANGDMRAVPLKKLVWKCTFICKHLAFRQIWDTLIHLGIYSSVPENRFSYHFFLRPKIGYHMVAQLPYTRTIWYHTPTSRYPLERARRDKNKKVWWAQVHTPPLRETDIRGLLYGTNLNSLNLFCDVIFSHMRKICYTHYKKYFKKTTRWHGGVVVVRIYCGWWFSSNAKFLLLVL